MSEAVFVREVAVFVGSDVLFQWRGTLSVGLTRAQGARGLEGDPAGAGPLLLRVGELTRSDLKRALATAGVRPNAHAETLLEDTVFERTEAETVDIVQRTVGELGLTRGAALPRILATAREH